MRIVFDRLESGERLFVESVLGDHELTFLDDAITPDTVIPSDAEILCVFVSSSVTRSHIASAPNLKLIATRSMGYDHVDLAAAAEHSVAVATVPAYGTHTVAEFTFALMLSLSRKVLSAYHRLKAERAVDAIASEGFDLRGKTLGVIGTGKIGKNVARIGKAFGMEIILHDAYNDEAFAREIGSAYVDLSDLMSRSDVISVHVPLLPSTTHLINAAMLAKSKPTAILINTARGGVVDTIALKEALAAGKLAGAGLDVFEGEKEIFGAERGDHAPTPEAEAALALLNMPNVIMTPHVAYDTAEAKHEILETTIANIRSYIEGNPTHCLPMTQSIGGPQPGVAA